MAPADIAAVTVDAEFAAGHPGIDDDGPVPGKGFDCRIAQPVK